MILSAGIIRQATSCNGLSQIVQKCVRRLARIFIGSASAWAIAVLRMTACISLSLAALTIVFAPNAAAQDPTKLAPEVIAPPQFDRGTNILGTVRKIDRTKPLYLQGDELIYDNKGNRVIARGNVEIFYNNFILTADEIIYDRGANTLTAMGNVELRDGNGGVTRGEKITLSDDFTNGFIQSLSITANDDTRITARRAIRRDANVTVFEDGKFTPCKAKNGMPPLWCITAKRVIHNQKDATITYENAQFEFLGAALFTIPYFQHADPSVKRKSGFLIPELSNSDDLGLMVETPYHFALGPNYDFTFHPLHASRQGILWQGDWRHKLSFGSVVGEYTVKLAGIDQDYTNLPTANRDLDGWRGSVETKGRFSLSSWWKFGWNVTIESDEAFRRFYKLDNILRTDRVNFAYLQGLSDRNHFSLIAYHFGGLLLSDTDVAESRVHPVLDWNYVVGQPVFGGELSWNVNALSFSRDLAFVDAFAAKRNVDTATHRLSADITWRRRLIDRVGITYTPFANLRGDVSAFDNVVDPISNMLIESETATRGVASAGLLAAYPWLARGPGGSHVIEPLGQLIVRTARTSQRNLPNEDARSLVFDDTNLFDVSKFSGYDRIETGTRANVGFQYTFQSDSGPYARILAGQSFHLAGTNPFLSAPGTEPSNTTTDGPAIYSTETGLTTSRSDYVVGAYLSPSTSFRLIGQARFDERDLSLRRADIVASANYGPASLTAIYAFTASDPALDLSDKLDEEEVSARIRLQLTQNWAATATLRYDIDANEARQGAAAISYSDDCFVLTATYIETYVEDPAAGLTPDQTVMLRFQLKHLGDFRYRTNVLEHIDPTR